MIPERRLLKPKSLSRISALAVQRPPQTRNHELSASSASPSSRSWCAARRAVASMIHGLVPFLLTLFALNSACTAAGGMEGTDKALALVEMPQLQAGFRALGGQRV